jgi:hypothetical protein
MVEQPNELEVQGLNYKIFGLNGIQKKLMGRLYHFG